MAAYTLEEMAKMFKNVFSLPPPMQGMFMPKQGPGPYGPNAQQGLANQGIGSANPNQAVTGNSTVWVSGPQGMGVGPYGSTQSQPTTEQLAELKFKRQVARAEIVAKIETYITAHLGYTHITPDTDLEMAALMQARAALLARKLDEE